MRKNTLLFVTQNQHKLEEVSFIFRQHKLDHIRLEGLSSIGFSGDIPENEPTLEGNASSKSAYIFQRYHNDCFADDTGLEVEALDGRPGVYSARYAGVDGNAAENVKKLLKELAGIENRSARFRTVISLIVNGKQYLFEGVVNGTILHEPEGEKGFGYDPVFRPDGHEMSFAMMDAALKNSISHRYNAILKMIEFLLSDEGKGLFNK